VSEEISIRFRWTANELVQAHRWHFRHRVRPLLRWAFGLLAVAFVVFGTLELLKSRSFIPGGLLLLVGLYIPLSLFVIRPALARRQFAKRPDRDSEITWLFTSDSIEGAFNHGKSAFTWSALTKVVQTREGFLLYPTEQIFHWIPRHGFASASDFDRLSQLAQQRAATFCRVA
jgi:hypothetical protein